MTQPEFRIVVSESLSEDALRRLREVGEVRVLDSCDDATVRAAIVDCDALVVRSYTRVTGELLESAGRLKVIGRAGIGLDHIDLAAAKSRGIVVVHTPAASTNSVAEHTFALLLAVERMIVQGDAMARDDRFLDARRTFVSRELGDLTLGVVGMGRIGRRVAEIGRCGFGMRVVYNDICEVGPFDFEAAFVSKDDLYGCADVITMHVPLTNDTRGMIGAEALGKFARLPVLLNTSRGAVVDGRALAKALADGWLAGAAVDVFDPEPPLADHPLLRAPRCVLSPHVASRSAGGLARMNDVVDDVLGVLRGERPRHAAEMI